MRRIGGETDAASYYCYASVLRRLNIAWVRKLGSKPSARPLMPGWLAIATTWTGPL